MKKKKGGKNKTEKSVRDILADIKQVPGEPVDYASDEQQSVIFTMVVNNQKIKQKEFLKCQKVKKK